MRRGRKPVPSALRKGGGGRDEPVPPDALPRCPAHLSDVARKEWRRLARAMHEMGVLTTVDRAALAAYCQAWGRWVEAEEKLRETPPMVKTPSGYVQQSPWMSVANKQVELMGRFMAELGMTPASRSRVALPGGAGHGPVMRIEIVDVVDDGEGNRVKTLPDGRAARRLGPDDQVLNVESTAFEL